jgi:hypothetical protein
MSDAGFGVAARAVAVPGACHAEIEIEPGRAASGAIKEKTRAIVKRIRFTVAPENSRSSKTIYHKLRTATELVLTVRFAASGKVSMNLLQKWMSKQAPIVVAGGRRKPTFFYLRDHRFFS